MVFWSAAACLLLMFLLFAMHRLIRGDDALTPEEARRKLDKRSVWATLVVPLAIGIGAILAFTFEFILPAVFEWILFGAGAGVMLFFAILIGPSLLNSGKSRPRERKFPLEPER